MWHVCLCRLEAALFDVFYSVMLMGGGLLWTLLFGLSDAYGGGVIQPLFFQRSLAMVRNGCDKIVQFLQ